MRFFKELRTALRMLMNNRGFFVLAVTTLAFGIGAATLVFSVTDSVLWRPLKFPHPNQLVEIAEKNPSRPWQIAASGPNFLDWRRRAHSFDSMAALNWSASHTLAGRDFTSRVYSSEVSSGFFETLGVAPALGRSFRVEEEQPGQLRAAILSDKLWREKFAGAPDVLGEIIKLDGAPFTIVGILPAGFTLDIFDDPEIYTTLVFSGSALDRGSKSLLVIGRMKSGIGWKAAGAEMAGLGGDLAASYPRENGSWTAGVEDLRSAFTKSSRGQLEVFLGLGGFVLLIACANISSLLLVRCVYRQNEYALRLVLGASRGALLRLTIAENAWIAIPGAGLGALLAAWGLEAIHKLMPADSIARSAGISLDLSALAFAAAVAMLATLLFSFAPILTVSAVDPAISVREAGRTVGASPSARRRINALIAAELTLAFVLLFGAGLFRGTYSRLLEAPLGFNPHQVLTMRIFARSNQTQADDPLFYSKALARMKAIGGVRNAALSSGLPVAGASSIYFAPANQARPERGKELDSFAHVISPEYFEVMQIALLRGRAFTDQDAAQSPRVAIVNENLARRVFGGEDPVGRQLQIIAGLDPMIGAGSVTIVGLAPNTAEFGPDEVPFNDIYLPFAQNPRHPMYIAAKTGGQTSIVATAARREIESLDREDAVAGISTMDDRLYGSLRGSRFRLALISLFAALAAIFAAIGVYGAITFSMANRAQEFGIRSALGASPGAILRLALMHTVKLAVAGAIGGFAAAFVLGNLLRSALYLVPAQHSGMLYGIGIHDPASFAAAGLVLLLFAGIAALRPAIRAMNTDPLSALRHT